MVRWCAQDVIGIVESVLKGSTRIRRGVWGFESLGSRV